MKTVIYDFPMLGIRKHASSDDPSLLRRLAPWAGGWVGANVGGLGGLAAAYPFLDIARRHADDSMTRVGPATVGTINHPNIRRAGRIMLLASLLPVTGMGLGAYGGYRGTKSLLKEAAVDASDQLHKRARGVSTVRGVLGLAKAFGRGVSSGPARATAARDVKINHFTNQANTATSQASSARVQSATSRRNMGSRPNSRPASTTPEVAAQKQEAARQAADAANKMKNTPIPGTGFSDRIRYGASDVRRLWNSEKYLSQGQRLGITAAGGALAGGTAVAGTGAVLRSGGGQQTPEPAQQQLPPQNPFRSYDPRWLHMTQR